jgi:5-hydroxyisourate hydrolase-like protein (transthyretin family)
MGLRPGWQYLFDRGLGASLAGHIVDAMTGEPVADATISLDGIMFSEGEVRRPEARFGRYHWIVQPGVYTVRVTAAGYESQAHTVVVGDQPTVVDVRLERRSQ